MQGGEQSDEPLLRRSSRRRRQNINRREAFTLTEAQVERARADGMEAQFSTTPELFRITSRSYELH
jgi:hypothetical protein